MWFMTFTGQPKDHHTYEHAHESPRVMTVPLVILAAFSYFVATGLPVWDAEASYLGNILRNGEPAAVHTDMAAIHHKAHEILDYHKVAGLMALAAAGLGIAFAFVTYHKKYLDPAEARAQFPKAYALLENKWYFDELYSVLVCRPALAIAGWFKNFDITCIDRFIDRTASSTIGFSKFNGKFDNGVVDGLVNVVGNSVRGLGTRLRNVQTGHLRGYVLFLALGAIALFALVTYFVSLAAAK
jgi:NADH-quinone oxidoreductase subunit L